MPSSVLYHVTPKSQLPSILATGLVPNAGKWHGPRRVGQDKESRRLILGLIGQLFRRDWAKLKDTGDGMYWIPIDTRRPATKRDLVDLAKLGWPWPKLPEPYVDKWSPQVFLTTSLLAAYEVAYEFRLDRHHGDSDLTILTIRRNHIPGTLVPDAHIHVNRTDQWRLARKRRGALMTDSPIPASAIVKQLSVPADLFGMAAFRRHLGVKTYNKRPKFQLAR